MSRLKDTLAQNLGSRANIPADQGKAVNLAVGGQYGYQPNFAAHVSNTGYTPRNIIPLLLEAPRGFQLLPNGDILTATLKALMETQAKQITGLRTGVNVEFSERAIGGAGHMHSDPTNVTEEMSQVAYVWDERYGRPIQNFWQFYIRNLIAEPITKQAGIMNLVETAPEDQLADFFSFTMLYIQPDPLRRRVDEAWLISQQIPTTSGILESQMDPTAGSDVPELSVEFRGIPIVGAGVRRLAQTQLDRLNYVGAGPLQRPAWLEEAEADIKRAENGYAEDIAKAAQSGIV